MLTLSSIVTVLAIVTILGFLAFIVRIAPFLDNDFKNFIKWVLIVIAAVVVITFAFGAIGLGDGILIGR